MLRPIRTIVSWVANPARARGRVAYPTLLNLPITGNCNSRCVMCDVWKTKSKDEITADQLRQVLSGRLFRHVQHVGISGGEPTLRRDLPECAAAIVDSLPKLKSLSVTSHGFQVARWKDFAPQMLKACEAKGVAFKLNFSLDGVGATHDEVRGIPKAFSRTMNSIELAEELGISVQLQATLSRQNVFGANRLLRFANKTGRELLLRRATTIERLSNRESVSDVALSSGEDSFLADLLRSRKVRDATPNPARRLFYRDLASRLEERRDRGAPCYFQREGLVLDEHGEMFHCSISTEPIGNALEGDQESLYFSQHSVAVRDRLMSNVCPGCTHDQSGAWSPVALVGETLASSRLGRPMRFCSRVADFASDLGRCLLVPGRRTDADEFDAQAPFRHALVVGAYGGEHVGDAAILGGVLMRLHAACGVKEATVLSSRPDRTRHWVSGLDLPIPVSVTSLNARRAREGMKAGTQLVWAGGPVMDSPPVLAKLLRVAKMAAREQIPFRLEGVGIGPFRSNIGRRLASSLLGQASSVSVRSHSYERAPVLVGKTVSVTEDPAFDYLATRRMPDKIGAWERESIDRVLDGEESCRYIGINLRPLWNKYYDCLSEEAEARYERMLDQLSTAMAQIACESEASPVRFVGFAMNADQYGFSDFDAAFRLEDRLAPSVDFRLLECELGVDGVLHLMDRLDGLIAMRFHAVIFGLSRSLPTLGIDYQVGGRGKVADLLASKDMAEQTTSIDGLESGWVADRLRAILSRPPSRKPLRPLRVLSNLTAMR